MAAPVYIYLLANPVINQAFYVGQSSDLQARLFSHLEHSIQSSETAKWKVLEMLLKARIFPSMTAVDTAPDRKAALKLERAWIDRLANSGFHLTNAEITNRFEEAEFHCRAIRVANAFGCKVSGVVRSQEPVVASNVPLGLPKRHGRSWSEAELLEVETMFCNGFDPDQISIHLGRTRFAILSKLNGMTANETVRRLLDSGGYMDTQVSHMKDDVSRRFWPRRSKN